MRLLRVITDSSSLHSLSAASHSTPVPPASVFHFICDLHHHLFVDSSTHNPPGASSSSRSLCLLCVSTISRASTAHCVHLCREGTQRVRALSRVPALSSRKANRCDSRRPGNGALTAVETTSVTHERYEYDHLRKMQLSLPTALPLPLTSFSPLLPLSPTQPCVDLGSTPPLPPVLTEAEKVRDQAKQKLTMHLVPDERVIRGDSGLMLHFASGRTPSLYYACPHYTEEEVSNSSYLRYRLLSLFTLPGSYFRTPPFDQVPLYAINCKRRVSQQHSDAMSDEANHAAALALVHSLSVDNLVVRLLFL